MDSSAAPRSTFLQLVADMAELVARAFFGGLAAAVAMGAAILALSANAQAATLNDTKTGELLLRTDAAGQYATAPKVSTEVAIEVSGMVARTRVTQHFDNPGSAHVEGIYVFPLPEKAAVDRLRIRIGSRTLEGRIREKGEARKAYEKAKAEGRKASLVEQQRPNLFTNSVAHIGPGERVEVTIEYQQALGFENGEYRLRFPLAVTPRYVPMAQRLDEPGREPEPAPQMPLQKRAASGEVVNPVDIAVFIDAGVPIASAKSSYHETAFSKAGDGRLVVQLVKAQEEADRDFELAWSLAPSATPRAALFTQSRGDTDYALLMVVPPQPSAAERAAFRAIPREMILVIDTSGSMQGASMEQARAALLMALGTLGPNDRFNVVEFNSVTRPWQPSAVAVTPQALAQAAAWVKKLKANGGTEMAGALTFALDGREAAGSLRQVIFVTDGAVGNEDALFKLIEERLGGSRLFTVGIGSAPNGHFMTRAAQFGRGSFTYIADVNEVNEKMARLFAKLESPVLRDVAIRWPDGTPVETFPPQVPDLYLGEPVLVAAAARAPLGTVVVTGKSGNQPWSVALTPDVDRSAAGVGALWARARISAHMDELARGAPVEDVKPKVVQVALEHHLVSAYTSLVAVDVTPTGPEGGISSALVKTSLPASYEGHLPQTDTAATLQMLLGLLALFAAGAVSIAGRLPAAVRA
jgi:Ca-activated chloride channel family protein